ncbi:MAG: hypothetical protein QJR09_11870 [Micrococcus sp.]|nr:hypothetical protein [Micrococcus sp.]
MSTRQPADRKVKMSEFKAQVAEKVLPPDGTVKVEIAQDTVVYLYLPLFLSGQELTDFQQQVQHAADGEERARLVFSAEHGKSPEEQWEDWQLAGYDSEDLALLFSAEYRAAGERLGEFRYSSS